MAGSGRAKTIKSVLMLKKAAASHTVEPSMQWPWRDGMKMETGMQARVHNIDCKIFQITVKTMTASAAVLTQMTEKTRRY